MSETDALATATLPDGSNNWAVHGSRTASGKPLVAGDPHRTVEAPNVYYQNHISCPEFDAIGFSMAGVPGMFHFGHNAQRRVVRHARDGRHAGSLRRALRRERTLRVPRRAPRTGPPARGDPRPERRRRRGRRLHDAARAGALRRSVVRQRDLDAVDGDGSSEPEPARRRPDAARDEHRRARRADARLGRPVQQRRHGRHRRHDRVPLPRAHADPLARQRVHAGRRLDG